MPRRKMTASRRPTAATPDDLQWRLRTSIGAVRFGIMAVAGRGPGHHFVAWFGLASSSICPSFHDSLPRLTSPANQLCKHTYNSSSISLVAGPFSAPALSHITYHIRYPAHPTLGASSGCGLAGSVLGSIERYCTYYLSPDSGED